MCGLAARFGLLLRELSVSPAPAASALPRSGGTRELWLGFDAGQELARLRLLRGQILKLVDVIEISEQGDSLG